MATLNSHIELAHKALAINGGARGLKRALPPRQLFDSEALKMVQAVFQDSWDSGQDFGFQGKYEELYTKAFVEFQGGGFADAVSSGTAALLIALMALDLPGGSDAVISPVTDPGGVSPLLFMGLTPVIADSCPGSFNTGPEEFLKVITPKTKVAVITHLAGIPVEMDAICVIAKSRGIKIIEDCSQAHGAMYKGRRVGTFGDAAFFSTMFSKTHATGGCGGMVYTRDEQMYWRMRSLADRGKPFNCKNADMKDPGRFLFPALNFNQNEIACALGLATLKKLQPTIEQRLAIVRELNTGLARCKAVGPVDIPEHAVPSPFFLTVRVDRDKINVSKVQFAQAVRAEGVWVNPDYKYVISEWDWMRGHVKAGTATPNASAFREETFNILFNERFSDSDIDDVINCFLKVDSVYAM
ncbi:MAG: hypothetical protein A3C36_01115 [Omnitrophica WOR_2 bacterium RIFCSPHIGHO2_02_FULL_52_10]|nr:MAG: hypothetical protein A3C36_01115 [Omnitrophica WOR_2 bacterium RIFCSPHIGHO2_02_FULL_52_10]